MEQQFTSRKYKVRQVFDQPGAFHCMASTFGKMLIKNTSFGSPNFLIFVINGPAMVHFDLPLTLLTRFSKVACI